jgi:hypothetical protein
MSAIAEATLSEMADLAEQLQGLEERLQVFIRTDDFGGGVSHVFPREALRVGALAVSALSDGIQPVGEGEAGGPAPAGEVANPTTSQARGAPQAARRGADSGSAI